MALLELVYNLIYFVYEEIRFRLYYGPVFHRFLNRKYTYYTRLPWKLKMKFLRLVRDHYEYFEFVGRDKLKLTRAMKAIICCGASQLVLFLPAESLTFFTRILVYPDYYSSRITHKRHKGEVNPGLHLIVFSWRGITEGLQRSEDGLNLLLHEFAHALWLEHKLMGHEFNVLDDQLVAEFEQLAAAEMHRMQTDEQHLFRRYALRSIEEFFAIAVENFFERPLAFKAAQPHLFHNLARLLRHDPLTVTVQPA
jgi:hypothetical protein